MSEQVSGQCLCGTVKFTVDGPFTEFHYCHCSRCRRASGSVHGANIFAKPKDLTWQTGEDSVKHYQIPDSHGYGRCFCKICGSPLPFDFAGKGKLLLVPAGSLDNPVPITPQDNIFWDDRADWHVESSELPCYPRYRK